MTIAAPRCTCEPSIFPDFGQPCPVHGSKHTKMMLDAQTTASARLKAENDRLRALYENAVGNRERFGWTINHLLECEDALAFHQAENEKLRAERDGLLQVIDAAHARWVQDGLGDVSGYVVEVTHAAMAIRARENAEPPAERRTEQP